MISGESIQKYVNEMREDPAFWPISSWNPGGFQIGVFIVIIITLIIQKLCY